MIDNEQLFSGYRRIPWLVRTHAVTVLPSVSTLMTLRSLPKARTTRLPFIGFGDPFFGPEEDETGALNKKSAPGSLASRGGQIHIRGIRVSKSGGLDEKKLSSMQLQQLARLPETADELRSMAQAVDADSDHDVFLGPRASEENVKTIDLANRRIVAFATHGLIPGDLDGLTQPALALSAPAVTRSREDGLLTMGEIMGLRLNADWVVLSACNTAAGQGTGAESVSGLGQAFFYAGTRALLVTSWPVENISAKILTTELFRIQAENPVWSRAQSFQKAMNGLLDRPAENGFTYAHPIFWAPFLLIGESAAEAASVSQGP